MIDIQLIYPWSISCFPLVLLNLDMVHEDPNFKKPRDPNEDLSSKTSSPSPMTLSSIDKIHQFIISLVIMNIANANVVSMHGIYCMSVHPGERGHLWLSCRFLPFPRQGSFLSLSSLGSKKFYNCSDCKAL